MKKPAWTIGKVEHVYLNHTFKYPSKVEWEDVEITLVDPVDPDMAATIVDIVAAAGYRPLQNQYDFATISKKGAISALGEVKIMQVNQEGKPIETWSLANAWVSKVDLGQLDYDSDELTEIKLTLTYDWAALARGNQRSNFSMSDISGFSDGLQFIDDINAESNWQQTQ